MLKYGECVAIFPEGGRFVFHSFSSQITSVLIRTTDSYTMPGMKDFKDGASWVRPGPFPCPIAEC